ncbi:SH3 domain-containing protein [Desulfobacca acetoxidans]|uniref:SH3 type 3 domain protein n=1 Tax=Desulfobacca acetoxidans (strain ATCC 700848 / DSM 11109 / ASRB2) TaxID=880072 RepID=F2NJU3_DESAR|nr:SH3 domain-containing protein [Desulfobacca acetoxidans]AEB09748.1 SH3 type 3 domain protein [Desulfobacca acetoxidans DSM 11109]
MSMFPRLLMLISLALGVWGCATTEPVKVETAPVERETFFYVGAIELPLKSSPEPDSSIVASVSLNDRVQQLERRGSWFLVRSEDGRQGWANDRDLELRPISELYVRRWGVSLRAEPQKSSKSLVRLRTNDQVTLLEEKPKGWVKISVPRTGKTGWLELSDLSLTKVAVRRVIRSKSGGTASAATEEVVEEAGTIPEEAPPSGVPSLLEPKPAAAATPPAKPAPAAEPHKAKPGMFEPL